jgi:hypothetical protein
MLSASPAVRCSGVERSIRERITSSSKKRQFDHLVRKAVPDVALAPLSEVPRDQHPSPHFHEPHRPRALLGLRPLRPFLDRAQGRTPARLRRTPANRCRRQMISCREVVLHALKEQPQAATFPATSSVCSSTIPGGDASLRARVISRELRLASQRAMFNSEGFMGGQFGEHLAPDCSCLCLNETR